ncbi:hypothetical protein C6N75_23905 [Streptomyces solincola]|uniref:Uncharacterized protein n=1 Tax=Streptomyces solincola TaxID=2100817 RepID=A0A2S9PQZ5_9ACTN|nr:hypothetical protein C6N75_23905 [Streptomyces solincola]
MVALRRAAARTIRAAADRSTAVRRRTNVVRAWREGRARSAARSTGTRVSAGAARSASGSASVHCAQCRNVPNRRPVLPAPDVGAGLGFRATTGRSEAGAAVGG